MTTLMFTHVPFPLTWKAIERTAVDVDPTSPDDDAQLLGSPDSAVDRIDCVLGDFTSQTWRQWFWNELTETWQKSTKFTFPGTDGELSGKITTDGRTRGYTLEGVTGGPYASAKAKLLICPSPLNSSGA